MTGTRPGTTHGDRSRVLPATAVSLLGDVVAFGQHISHWASFPTDDCEDTLDRGICLRSPESLGQVGAGQVGEVPQVSFVGLEW